MEQSINDLLDLAQDLDNPDINAVYADRLRRIVHNMYGEMQDNLVRSRKIYDDLTRGMVVIENRYKEIGRSL